jgi:hypothetical protein
VVLGLMKKQIRVEYNECHWPCKVLLREKL